MYSPASVMCDSMSGESAHHSMMAEQMPCSSHEQPASPDCSMACPMVALCFGKIFPAGPVGNLTPHALDIVQVLVPGNGLFPDTLERAPPLQPPQA